MLEKTFTMVKPCHFRWAEDIFKELDNYGNRILSTNVWKVPKEIIEEHYSVHRGKYFFEYMTQSFIGESVAIAIYEGDNVIKNFIEIIGHTDPSKAPKTTIRGRYSNDSLEKAASEKRPLQNVIHRSDSPEEALREIAVWERCLK